MQMLKLISFFIGRVNVTEWGISNLYTSFSELFREGIFKLVRLHMIGAKI